MPWTPARQTYPFLRIRNANSICSSAADMVTASTRTPSTFAYGLPVLVALGTNAVAAFDSAFSRRGINRSWRTLESSKVVRSVMPPPLLLHVRVRWDLQSGIRQGAIRETAGHREATR